MNLFSTWRRDEKVRDTSKRFAVHCTTSENRVGAAGTDSAAVPVREVELAVGQGVAVSHHPPMHSKSCSHGGLAPHPALGAEAK